MSHGKRWTAEHDDLLRTWHDQGVNQKIIARRLHRSLEGVKRRITILGIQKKRFTKYERCMVVLNAGTTAKLDAAAFKAGVTRARFVRNIVQAAVAGEVTS